MSAYCSQARCGHCGACTAAWEADEPLYDYCLWCALPYPVHDVDFWPYCSSGCALQAERDSVEGD